MAHLPLKELIQRLADAEKEVEVGGRYGHYKDPTKEYIVKSLALLEATDEVMVIYEGQYNNPRVSYIRPLASFCEVIDIAGVPTPRFTKMH